MLTWTEKLRTTYFPLLHCDVYLILTFFSYFFVSDAFSIIKEYSTNYSIDICCRCNSKVKEKIPEIIPKKMFQLLLSLANTCWQKQMLIIFDKYCNNTYCFALTSHLNHSYVQVPSLFELVTFMGNWGLRIPKLIMLAHFT